MRLLIATRNSHKLAEIREILGGNHEYQTLQQFAAAPSVEENASTFEGNATLKAVTLARWSGANHLEIDYVLADDSGLEVDALQGAPGVHSARFAALDNGAIGNSPDADNNAKLLKLLSQITVRSARFRCVIALTPLPADSPGGFSRVCAADEAEMSSELFSGSCEGRIIDSPRGTHGFGYDPLFVPDGFSRTFAELADHEKNRISHRSKALENLADWLRRRGE